MDQIGTFLKDYFGSLTGLDLRFSLIYLAVTVALAFLIWCLRRSPTPFLRWLLPRQVFLHRSNLLDIKLFLTNHAMTVAGAFGPVLFSPVVAFYVANLLSGASLTLSERAATSWGTSLLVTLIIVVSTDFCKYWSHRLHHETRFLWPFHAVHHSAEVLTPLTLARSHPMEAVVRNLIISVVVGLVQGVLLFAMVGSVDLVTVGGANLLYFVFNMLGANLRHSHIWLSYGRVLEHVFISPAQHQIHHSIAREHHDKNYGSIFALWDWMFGTLYIPEAEEPLTFGVSEADGTPIEQPHPTLRAALLGPFRESWAALRGAPQPPEPDTAPHHPAE